MNMEIAVISGKGGTGKSFVSAAFATIPERVFLSDCDVDAANLYLIFSPEINFEQIYIAGQKAEIDYNKCTNCGYCVDFCRFDAMSIKDSKVVINETLCDGCHLCARICPENAITMLDNDKSRMYAGTFRNGQMVYGRLAPGEENSGKLVSMIREKAKTEIIKGKFKIHIIDGPPGIGCATISSITGVDRVVIVTEPTLSGIHDLKRTVELVSKFDLKTWVIINKYDLNTSMSLEIENYCKENNILFAGKIPFDKQVVEAMMNCKSIIEYRPKSEVSKIITDIFNKIQHAN